MFIYTRAYFQKLINDFKTADYVFNILTPLIYIAYLLYAIFTPVGYMWANIILFAITVLYLVFYIATYDLKQKSFKSTKKAVKKIYKAIKLTVSGITLGITFYGIYNTTSNTSILSVVLNCFMAIFWIFQVGTELIVAFLDFQVKLFLAALEADKDALMKPIAAVGNFVKKVAGKEPDEPKKPNKILGILDKTIEKIKNKNKKDIDEEYEGNYASHDNETITK